MTDTLQLAKAAIHKDDPNWRLREMTALDDEMDQYDTCGLCGGSFNDKRHIFLSGDCPEEVNK